MIEFKITDAADQKFSTIINSRRVTFRLRYNYVSQYWSFDMALDGDYILHGRRIVLNTDLVAEFDFGIGRIFAYSTNNSRPGRQELINGTVKFYQANEDEINAAVA